jgi:hypothetical protein
MFIQVQRHEAIVATEFAAIRTTGAFTALRSLVFLNLSIEPVASSHFRHRRFEDSRGWVSKTHEAVLFQFYSDDPPIASQERIPVVLRTALASEDHRERFCFGTTVVYECVGPRSFNKPSTLSSAKCASPVHEEMVVLSL